MSYLKLFFFFAKMTTFSFHSMSCLIFYMASWAFIPFFLVFGSLFYMLYVEWGCSPVSQMQLDTLCHVVLCDYMFHTITIS